MRFNVPSDVALKPGPGAYLPEKVFGECVIMYCLHTLILHLEYRLTKRLTNLNTVSVSSIQNTCLVRGLYPEKRLDLYLTNRIHR